MRVCGQSMLGPDMTVTSCPGAVAGPALRFGGAAGGAAGAGDDAATPLVRHGVTVDPAHLAITRVCGFGSATRAGDLPAHAGVPLRVDADGRPVVPRCRFAGWCISPTGSPCTGRSRPRVPGRAGARQTVHPH
ncbi:hypothetical protein HBB16_19120 [Pseudonocardia sp. MCCB 268]|nr:hypothetical protein [Pseudonocardia cytotoxica]